MFGNPEKVIMEVNYSMSRAQNALMAKWQFRTRAGPMKTTYLREQRHLDEAVEESIPDNNRFDRIVITDPS